MNVRFGATRWSGWVGGLLALALCGVATHARADDNAAARAVVTGTVVDEAGKPLAGVRVSAKTWEPVEPVTTSGDGAFRLSLPTNDRSRVYATVVARADDGRLGLKAVSFEAAKSEPVTITVKAARRLEVRVNDGAGLRVAGADVHIIAGFQQVASGQTDAMGRWTAEVPADVATAWRVYALKAKVGFDYAQAERARDSTEPPLALPERLTLTLDGARPPLRIKTVDRAGKPLAGIAVGPWLIWKRGHESDLNGIQDAFPRTDAAGVAMIDWLPARQEGKLSIVSGASKGYYPPDPAVWLDADPPVGEVTLTFFPLEALSGRVTTADGRPAAGAIVRVQGQGCGQNEYQGETHTDAGGRFRLEVYSEQAYILTAVKDELAAPYRSGVVVRAGKPVEGVDLVLGLGTRLKGQVTVGKEHKPVAKASVTAVIDGGSIPAELKREGDRFVREMSMWTCVKTDANGRYELVLGPGKYRIEGPRQLEPVMVVIPANNAPRELVRDFAMPRAERGPFTISVVDEAGKPVANAVVDGAYQARDAYFFRMAANADGTVHLERSLDPLILVAVTPDQSRAGSVRVDAEAAEATVVVKPAATASGRLVDPEGKPIPGLKLNYGVLVPLGRDPTGVCGWFFGGEVTTDPAGNFRLLGLVRGETYQLFRHNEAGPLAQAQTQVKPTDSQLLALGDVTIDLNPPKPKPYVPPTPAQRTRDAFAARKEKTAREKVAYTLVEAKREYTRPMLLFGNPQDAACIDLFRLFSERPRDGDEWAKTPAGLRWDFELAALDTGQADAQALATDLGVAAGNGAPSCLAVLNDDGGVAANYPLRPAGNGKLDPRALAAFLLEHKRPTRDAEAMLSRALAQAKTSDRRVFLIMSASWCGPCRLLARFLSANKAELGQHYVFVKLDISRDTHAQELVERYEGKNGDNGVPWYVILDAAGKPLIASNAKESEESGSTNIGFPSTKSGIDHFVTMLRQTAPRLSDDALASLRRQLEKQP